MQKKERKQITSRLKALMMTSAQVVRMSVNVITISPSQDYTHQDNHTSLM